MASSNTVQYDINGMGQVPTFRPTIEEFSNFSRYVQSIEPLCSCGLAKIIPPEEWNKDFNYDDLDITIPAPITQYLIVSQRICVGIISLVSWSYRNFIQRAAYQ